MTFHLWRLLAACGRTEPEPVVDDVPPTLAFTEPAAAAFLPTGEVRVEGTATGLTELTLDGAPVALIGSGWTAEVDLPRGIHTFEVEGLDASSGDRRFRRQSVIAGSFAPATGPVTEAVGVRLNQGGLDAAAGFIEGLVDPAALSSGLSAANPVYQDSWGVLGLDAVSVEADLGSVAFLPPDLQAQATPGALVVHLVIPQLDVWVPVRGAIVGVDFDADAWIGCDRAVVDASVSLGTDGAGGLTVDVVDPTIALEGFWYDTSLVPGDALTGLFVGTLQGALEDMIVAQVDAMLPDLLAAQLGAADDTLGVELLGTLVAITPGFRTALVDRDGVLLVLDLTVEIPVAAGKEAPGSLLAADALPTPDTRSDVSLAAADDFVNRVLFEAWQGGMIDQRLSSDDGTLDPVLLHELGAVDAATLQIVAGLPPILTETDGQARLELGELVLRVETPGGTKGELLEVAVAAQVPLQLSVEDGVLIGQLLPPTLSFVVRDTDWLGSDETITRVLEASLPVDELLMLFGRVEFPLPEVGGRRFGNADFTRDGSGVFTNVSMDF